ncbi:hypothetical protein MMC26_000925 [Xylographa opegraphella]|nr:hypothetical protein [Xylographa opegraphella]
MVGQGKRGANKGSKKTAASQTQNTEDSYIVFSNAKDEAKNKKASSKASASKDGVAPNPATGEDVPKKPDTRELIGGASWTGKLPVNILSEHCQKQKWEKPEYTMAKSPEGFSSMVILKAMNPKTKEMSTLPPFKLPPTYKHLAVQSTAVEARHFAATYALFRICSMRNIHMMLPPNYKDLWKGEFEVLKKEDVRDGKGWMYEADPFAAKHEREEAQALLAKKRDEREKQRAKEADQPSVPGATKPNGTHGNKMRGWIKVPKVEMGKRTRVQVEDLVRRHAIWNPHAVVLSEFQKRNIVNELVELGFRKSHVEEASEECKDREETLEWLLIHVPEDDLPRWSLPEGYVAGITMASGNIKRETSIKRLSDSGYAAEICEKFLVKFDGNEGMTAEALQNLLFHDNEDENESLLDMSGLDVSAKTEGDRVWQEELETLQSIYGYRFRKISSDVCQIELQLPRCKTSFVLSIRRSRLYPLTAPVVSLSSPGLPAYIRLSMYRQVISYAKDNLLNQPMVFNLVDWLETEIPRIIENPGKLRDVSAAATTTSEVPQPQTMKTRKHVRRRPLPIQWTPGNTESMRILSNLQARQETSQQRKMQAGRQSLPAWSLREAIVKTVEENQVTIISGETGSGKSTQSVQFVLDDMIQRQLGSVANIICTQPRRISALGLADRVSDERCSVVGDEVGYAIRGESKQKPGITKITFVTIGVLLRRLQTSGGSTDDVVAALADVSHVVVDEVHERSLDTDFLLILLRSVLIQRKDLKIILMSATLDAGVFERYFHDAATVGKIEIQGRTFPVDDYYLDDVISMTNFNPGSRYGDMDEEATYGDQSVASTIQAVGMRINYNLIAATVSAIDAQLGSIKGGILIFLPGVMEINRTLDAIRSLPNIHALPLHASLMSSEQRRVFPPAPKGKRKVIAATNVAETSITIEDIVAVIDTGKVKETSFDPQNNMVKLEEVSASRAACKQRRGRAGRVRAGKCYKLYTRNAETKMAERPEPEIRRVPLEQLCLSVRAMGITDIPSFLASTLTPPESMAVEGAIDLLGKMGALDGDELTALGQHLAMIPADLRCGKLMVYGAIFGCLEATLTIASILTIKSPFVSSQTAREESKTARAAFAPSQGDLLADLAAFNTWLDQRQSTASYRALRSWCDTHFLSQQTLSDISSTRSQYVSSLTEAGFLPIPYDPSSTATSHLNAHNESLPLLRALIAAAFNPQLARIEFPSTKYAASSSGAVALDPEARTIKYFTPDSSRVFVHPSSTLFHAQVFPGAAPPVCLAYFSKIATSKVFVRDLVPCGGYAALMFGGRLELDSLGRGIVVGGWLRMRGWARIGVLVGRLRGMVEEVLRKRVDGGVWGKEDEEVVGVVRKLVELDGMDR